MKPPRLTYIMVLLPLWLPVVMGRSRGSNEEGTSADQRVLKNVFDADELRHSLTTQREPYQDPFRGEPKVNTFSARKNARQGEFRKMKMSYYYEELADNGDATGPLLDLHLGKGKGNQGSSKSSSKGSKGMSKSMMGKSKSAYSAKMNTPNLPVLTVFPTIGPSSFGSESSAPTTPAELTDKPTCFPPSSLTPDVSGFFQAPPADGGEGNALQNELDSALNEIQVPGSFQTQCVERR